jgi:hypothetical protein
VVPPRPWYEVLHVSPEAPMAVVDDAYKAVLEATRPDVGGSPGSLRRHNGRIERPKRDEEALPPEPAL